MKRLGLALALIAALSCEAAAQVGGLSFPGPGPRVASAPTTTTWDPSDIDPGITLSPDKLTATSGAGFAYALAKAIASHSTGKFYHETTFSTFTSNNQVGIGLAAATVGNSGTPLGAGADSVAYNFSTNFVINSSSLGNGAAWGAGDVLGCAVDLGAKLLWVRVNAGLWNNSGTANPATGVGGINISSLAAVAYFPAITLVNTGDVAVANFGATAYANAAPAGFVNW